MSCIDLFGQRLLPRIGSEPVLAISLPPGQEARDAHTILDSQQVHDLGVLDGPQSLLSRLAGVLGTESAVSVDDFVLRHVERLQWPRLMVGQLVFGSSAERAVEAARRLAEATRDLAGPLRFALMISGGSIAPPGEQALVWEPLFGVPHPLPFHLSNRPLRDAGFDTYLACRIYWEGSGRPGHMRVFADALLRRATELMLAADADERIDRTFDACWERAGGSHESIRSAFQQACEPTEIGVVLRTGILANSRLPIEELESVGLCWRPPGTLHALLTPMAAFELARTARTGLQPRERVQLRRAARHNQLLGAWVLQLTSQIERELVWRCQREGRVDERLAEAGLLERLRAELQRCPSGLAYCPSDDPLDYASFGELVSLLGRGGSRARSDVSRTQLDEARHARNLSAHLHPVTWRAVSSVLQLLDQLVRLNRRAG